MTRVLQKLFRLLCYIFTKSEVPEDMNIAERSGSEASQYFRRLIAYKPSALSKKPFDLVASCAANVCLEKHSVGQHQFYVKIHSASNAKQQF